jgi:hypothetical protein
VLVQPGDSVALLTASTGNIIVNEGTWVRVKRRGLYYGDLAFVHRVLEPGRRVTIRLIPRIHPDNNQSSKRKRSNSNARPPQQFFNGDVLTQVYAALREEHKLDNQVQLFSGTVDYRAYKYQIDDTWTIATETAT